jgi:hypothetical protein
MSYIQKIVVDVTVDALGDAVVYTPVLTGKLSAIAYIKTDFADGAHVNVANESSGEVYWIEADVNASKVPHLRTGWQHSNGLTPDEQVGLQFFTITDARLIFTIATGGISKSGKFVIYLE